jgi:predicted transcriptional regulator
MNAPTAWLVALVATLALPLAGAETYTLADAGVVALEVDAESMDDCATAFWLAPCVAAYGDAGTMAVGDDEAAVGQHVEEVRLVVRGVPASDVEADLSTLEVSHPLFRVLNATWVDANDSLPDAAKAFVTLESRPTSNEAAKWGLFILFHPPPGTQVPGTSEGVGDVWVGACYDPCATSNSSFLASDEDSVQPFPHNVWLQDANSDAYAHAYVEAATTCWYPDAMPAAACDALAAARPNLEAIVGAIASLTPEADLGFELGITSVHFEPSASAAPGTSGAPDATSGRGERSGVLSPSDAPRPGAVGGAVVGLQAPKPVEGNVMGHWAALFGESSSPWGVSRTASIVAAVAALAASIAVVLYHRIVRARALEQATRRKVYDSIAAAPGIRVGTLASHLELNYNTTLHHVRLLRETGLVEGFGSGQTRLFVRGASLGMAQKEAAVAAASPVAARVLRHVEARGAVDFVGLREELGLPKSSASEAVSRLCQAGLVEKRRLGGRLLVARAGPTRARPPGAAHLTTAEAPVS